MTELPPIIERLDALQQHVAENVLYDDTRGREKAMEWVHEERGKAYGELRAELLRLQEERDQARQERDSRIYILRDDAIQAAQSQRDALLEALKEFVDAPTPEHMTWEELCVDCGLKIAIVGHADDCDWVKYAKARENARRTIANVEGKDG